MNARVLFRGTCDKRIYNHLPGVAIHFEYNKSESAIVTKTMFNQISE